MSSARRRAVLGHSVSLPISSWPYRRRSSRKIWKGEKMHKFQNREKIRVRERSIGEGEPVYVIGEIGINHNGSVELALKMIEGARSAGCDAVKFQKRTPEICVPASQWNIERDTPWG